MAEREDLTLFHEPFLIAPLASAAPRSRHDRDELISLIISVLPYTDEGRVTRVEWATLVYGSNIDPLAALSKLENVVGNNRRELEKHVMGLKSKYKGEVKGFFRRMGSSGVMIKSEELMKTRDNLPPPVDIHSFTALTGDPDIDGTQDAPKKVDMRKNSTNAVPGWKSYRQLRPDLPPPIIYTPLNLRDIDPDRALEDWVTHPTREERAGRRRWTKEAIEQVLPGLNYKGEVISKGAFESLQTFGFTISDIVCIRYCAAVVGNRQKFLDIDSIFKVPLYTFRDELSLIRAYMNRHFFIGDLAVLPESLAPDEELANT